MNDYIIFTDSGCDIPERNLTAAGIRVVDLSFVFNGEDRVYKNREMPTGEFYARMRSGQIAKTSGVNSDDFCTAFRTVLESGRDILYIGFSSALSCTYQASLIAIQELRAEFPDRKILTMDTLCACAGLGLLLYLVNRKKADGLSIEEATAYAEGLRGRVCHWFTVDDLVYLRRGGRISATAAAVGHILNIKPILHVDTAGHLAPVFKTRGRKNAVKALAEQYAAFARSDSNTVFIGHSDCIRDASLLADLVREENRNADVHIYSIGPVVGAHSGPGTLAIFFVGEGRCLP